MREDEKKPLARRLRRDTTDAEALLWRRIRDRALFGRKFRRQHPIGPYVADFVCIEARLVVELDGGQHDRGAEGTSVRTAFLERRGFRVLRFWNNDVLANLDGVLERIVGTLEER
jgi:primosomal protein N' (replication factor Y)